MYRAGEGSILATKIEADDSRREGTGHFDKKTPLNGKKKPGTKVSAKSLNAIDSLTFQQDNELKRPRSNTNEICGASIEENKARQEKVMHRMSENINALKQIRQEKSCRICLSNDEEGGEEE